MSQITVLKHSSIRIQAKEGTIYIDPYQIEEASHDAEYIFITHSHYDHFSPEDIEKIKKPETKIITVASSEEEAEKIVGKDQVTVVKPNQEKTVGTISFQTVPAYNRMKPFHPKKNEWVGYILELEGKHIYIAGDTDALPELAGISCNIALVPIGGTYTMTAKEAAKLINQMQPKKVIPTHYGLIVGNAKDAKEFQKLVQNIEVEIQI